MYVQILCKALFISQQLQYGDGVALCTCVWQINP